MDMFSKILMENPEFWDKAVFYTFFLGILLATSIILLLLFEKERLLIPFIILSLAATALAAWDVERKGPFFPFGKEEKLVVVTKTVQLPGKTVEVYRDAPRQPRPAAPGAPAQPRPSVSFSGPSGPTVRVEAPPLPAARSPEPSGASEPPAATPPPARPAPAPAAEPAPAPIVTPRVVPTAARTEPTPSAPASEPSSPRTPPPEGGEEPGGIELPTGTLVIQINDSVLITVPGEATKVSMNIFVDGKYVGGRKPASMRVQKDDAGNVMNVTYIWKGVTVRIANTVTGNHKVTVGVSASGADFKKSKTSWSGSVYVGENATATIVLVGGMGETLSRAQ